MLSIGWTEMLIVAAIALIVVGPKDLPALLQQVGKFAGQIRRMGNDFKAEINKAVAVDELKDLKQSVTSPLTDARRDMEKTFNSIGVDGSVKPSGAISPRDANSESVADEIREAAGMPAGIAESTAATQKSVAQAVKEQKEAAEAQAAAIAEAQAAEAEAKPKTRAKRTSKAKTGAAAKTGTSKSTTSKSTTKKASTRSRTSAAKTAASDGEDVAATTKPKSGRASAAKKTTRKPATPRTRRSTAANTSDGTAE